jgi:hypothetical protein
LVVQNVGVSTVLHGLPVQFWSQGTSGQLAGCAGSQVLPGVHRSPVPNSTWSGAFPKFESVLVP